MRHLNVSFKPPRPSLLPVISHQICFGHTPFLLLSPQLFSFSVVCPFGCWEIDNEEKSAVTKGRSTLLGGKSVNIPASPYVWNKDWDGEQRVGILQFAW